jgi:xanthine dehydrogenase accessory factor
MPTTAEGVTARWLHEGRTVAVALLIETVGSSPFEVGAQMAMNDAAEVEGSVTGGCVEAAVAMEAEAIMRGGPPKLLSFGVDDARAVGVGLTCGGTVRLFLHRLDRTALALLEAVAEARDKGVPVAVATLSSAGGAGAKMAVFEDRVIGTLGSTDLLDRTVIREARGLLDEGLSMWRHYGTGGETMGSDLSVLIKSYSGRPSMVIFGAIDFSAELARLATTVGYKVTICDPRAPFVSSSRFHESAEVIVDWPDQVLDPGRLGPRDAVLVFTHDPKLDEPALIAALASGAGYVGALGSRRTHRDRRGRLREVGVDESEIDRIHSPCGLDVGARTPAETAISVLGEIIATRTGRRGLSLKETDGPIHPRRAETGRSADR